MTYSYDCPEHGTRCIGPGYCCADKHTTEGSGMDKTTEGREHKPVQTDRAYLVSEREIIDRLRLTGCTKDTKIVAVNIKHNGVVEIVTREGQFA